MLGVRKWIADLALSTNEGDKALGVMLMKLYPLLLVVLTFTSLSLLYYIIVGFKK